MPGIGDPAPQFSGEDVVNGGTFSLADHQGSVILVAFNGLTWCAPCQFEAPVLQDLWEEFGGATQPDVQFVMVSVNDSQGGLENAVESFGLTMPVVYNPGANIDEAYGVNAVPALYFVDTEGVICDVKVGAGPPADALREDIRSRLEKCGATPGSDVLRPRLREWLAVATILFGVTSDGEGLAIRPGGTPVPIDPWGPLRDLSRSKREALVALSVTELAKSFRDLKTRRAVEQSGMRALRLAVDGIARDMEEPSGDFRSTMPVR
jgi:peroxiredoxin